jgi:PAS domain S-box-containing protein
MITKLKNDNLMKKEILAEVDIEKVVSKMSTALVIADVNGTILYLNEEAANYHVPGADALKTGESFFGAVPHEWQPLANDILNELVSSGRPNTIDASWHNSAGKKVVLEIKCNCIADRNGAASVVFIEGRDVSLRKIIEKKISAVAHDLSGLIENANAVIIGTDSGGYITDWNELTSKITGYSKADAFARKFQELLLDSPGRETFSDLMTGVLKGEPLTNYELDVRGQTGQKLVFLINVTPRRNAAGDVIGMLLIGHDHTELSEYRKFLEMKIAEGMEALKVSMKKEQELVEVKKKFVAIASHEFRSPLSAINFNVEFVIRNIDQGNTRDVTEKLQQIQFHVNHMSSLLEDLLTISKNDSGKIIANMQPVELLQFFSVIIEEVKNNNRHSHQVVIDFPKAEIKMSSDPKLLRNIFINLLTNAMKFSPDSEQIFLSVKYNDPLVTIEVRDAGIGISEKDRERIFEPFNRGSNAGEIKGTGLGLSIVKKAVETLGGNVTVESKVSEGTIFTVNLKALKTP